MDIFQSLENSHSKENIASIIAYIGKDKNRFRDLMDCFFMVTKDYRVPQRAAHAVALIFEKNPDLVKPYIPEFIDLILISETKNAIKRNILRILQKAEIEEKFRGNLYSRLFEILACPNEEIAVRAFSITVLYNITEHHKALKPELKSLIEMVLAEPECSKGVRSRAVKALLKLEKEQFSGN